MKRSQSGPLLALLFSLLLAAPEAGAEQRPAVLIHSPRGLQTWWVDLQYLRELREAGFEVDYTDRPGDLSWERLQPFNVLVLYNSIDNPHFFPESLRGQRDAFLRRVERFLGEGGGVLLMAQTYNGDEYVRALLEPWGARIPFERLREEPGKLRSLPRMRGREALAFTRNVAPSAVSRGVEQIWYPLFDQYNAGTTAPIHVSDAWQVVVRGSPTSRTQPVRPNEMSAPPAPFVRAGGVAAPPLFAMRPYRSGRIALTSMWAQFSIGQGTRWLYDRRVLSRGFDDRPSHFGRLLENSLRWLAAPSLESGKLGGHRTDDQRLLPPNERAAVRAQTRERVWREGEHDDAAREGWELFRGLIGARTKLTSGRGSVADHARAARAAGLDFLVFLEDFEGLTAKELETLKARCAEHSGPDLLLLPGYRIDNNTGNHMFLYGETVAMPPPEVLIGQRLNQQYQNPQTGAYEFRLPLNYWLLNGRGARTNVGYYLFGDDPRSQKLPDLRTYSMAALRTYRNGELLEDVSEDYLRTAQGSLPPTPVSVNLVDSPQANRAAVASRQSLTYARARSLATVWEDALQWSSQYSAPHVFVSSGPRIHAWPAVGRVFTHAAESFVTGRTRMPALLDVRSDVGLEEVTLHDGNRLFRRFLPGGQRQLRLLLQLEGSLQRQLVVVARDVEGGSAVSFARRSWKEDDMTLGFCGDRVNDCRNARLGRGPGIFLAERTPAIDGGYTWDGGPQAVRPLLPLHRYEPILYSNRGNEGERRFRNVPLLEAADEGVVAVRSTRDHVYDEEIEVRTAWSTFGPIEPSRLMRYELSFTEFARPGVGPHPSAWFAWPDSRGAITSLYQDRIRFLRDLRIERLKVLQTRWITDPLPFQLVFGDDDEVGDPVEVRPGMPRPVAHTLETGGWLAVFAEAPANGALLLNRGAPLRVRTSAQTKSVALMFDGDVERKKVEADQELHYEILTVVDPLDAPPRGAKGWQRRVRYLAAPDGLELKRGRRVPSPGLLELEAEGGAAELQVKRPPDALGMSLPVRVTGLRPRWSAGLLQHEGYNTGFYAGGGENRYRPVAVDSEGRAHASLFPDRAPRTRVSIGHPVVSDHPDLFIQVTQMNQSLRPRRRSAWHVSVNNPGDEPVTATFRPAMALPDFTFEETRRTVPAGGYLVLFP